MSDDDDLKLNTLHRFSKHSRLVLESHSHCEVPAGCGGAVLQWLDPRATVPLRIEINTGLLSQETFLDGQPLRSSRAQPAPGEHVLAIHLAAPKNARRAVVPYLLVTIGRVLTPQEIAPLPGALSAGDGTWRMTGPRPPADWASVDFADAAWSRLGPSAVSAGQLDEWARADFERMTALGAVALDLPAAGAWVRKRFTVPRSQP